MAILLSFAPFIIFALLLHLGDVEGALWAGAGVAALLIIREKFVLRRSAKLLELATLLLFMALALYSHATNASWTIPQVRLVVDFGLFLIVAGSLLLGKPFTRQYAREQASPDVWNSFEFNRVNFRISSVWALTFAVLVAADAVMVWLPRVPHFVSVAVTVAALVGAYKYTAGATPSDVRTSAD